MNMAEHVKLLDGGDYSPRVLERRLNDGRTGYYAWWPDREGPMRHDHQSAAADLVQQNVERERREKALILRAALLWARNHLDTRVEDAAFRDKVIGRLDRVLKDYEPTVTGMRLFREKYPADA